MKHAFSAALFVLMALGAVPHALMAQESQVLSVTPPFSQMVVKPGDVFKSYLKIINANSYPLTVYATPVNFESSDEQGHPKFIPLTSDPVDATTFAGWIDITREPITIPPESSTQVDYVVTVPEAAPPGGHFAAVLIGTRRPGESGEAGVVKTSQVVSSLFLARVAGDVVEEGQIREFSVAHTFTNTPQAEFILRFENSGNVYLQPQGDITIFNMWGKERGFIPVNHKTNFGNVLPKSVRKFSFTWEGTPSITDIGRYKAVATLSYGIDAKESVYRTVYFWVIPVKATLITLGFIALFASFVFLSIRLYVRRVLDMAGIDPVQQRKVSAAPTAVTKRRVTQRELVAPLKAGVLDLRRVVVKTEHAAAAPLTLRTYIQKYRTFIAALCIGFVGVALIVWYIMDAREVSRPYEVTMRNENGEVTLSKRDDTTPPSTPDDTPVHTPEKVDVSQERVRVSLVNASGVPGAGGSFISRLEKEGYAVGDISTDADTRERSVIVYNAALQQHAKSLSELWDNIPLSVRPAGEETAPEILIIIGSDRAQ